MANLDTEIIYDKNGNPIPQFLDTSDKSGGEDGTMKPITGDNGAQNIQVTGSNVEEIFSEHDFEIEPKSKYYIKYDGSDLVPFKAIYAFGRSVSVHTFKLDLEVNVPKGSGYQFVGRYTIAKSSDNSTRMMSDSLHSMLPVFPAQFAITNDSNEKQTYHAIQILGVK